MKVEPVRPNIMPQAEKHHLPTTEEDEIDFLEESKKHHEESSYYQLKQMKQIHHEIAMLGLLGYNHEVIAKKLDISRTMVDYTLGSKIVKEKIKILRKERDKEAVKVNDRIEELQPLAIETLESVMVDPNTSENGKIRVAQDLLDRGGHGAVDLHADVSDKMSTDDINEIKQRAKSAGMMVDDVEEAEYEEVEENSNEKEQT